MQNRGSGLGALPCTYFPAFVTHWKSNTYKYYSFFVSIIQIKLGYIVIIR